MLILSIRTNQPKAELGLFEDDKKLAYIKWQADRQLAETIHKKIDELLNKSSKSLKDIEGIVCFEGPGSFTGLRIGFAVANALAYSQDILVVATAGDGWVEKGIKKLEHAGGSKIALPKYGSPPKTGGA